MRRSPSEPPEKGDLVRVEWLDIFEDSLGDPKNVVLCKRTSFGLFWGKKEVEGVTLILTTTTVDSEEREDQIGYCAYPEGIIRKLTVVKRKRTRLKKEQS